MKLTVNRGALADIITEPFVAALLARAFGVSAGMCVWFGLATTLVHFATAIAIATWTGRAQEVWRSAWRNQVWGGRPPVAIRPRRIGRVKVGRTWRNPKEA